MPFENEGPTTLAADSPEVVTTTGSDLPAPSLRESLSAGLEEFEGGDGKKDDRPRHEDGKFAPRQMAGPAAQSQELTGGPQPLPRPTTWKKEYLPLWDKLTTGQQLTADEARKLAEYSNQRETEYKTGVSTYRAEAEQAKHLQAAIEPFMADLQKHNIPPAQFISNLGNAHRILALGSPEQKIGLFRKLAQDYGIPIEAIGNSDNSAITSLMSQIDQLKQQVGEVSTWRATRETSELHTTIKSFQEATDATGAPKYPHFETLRESMAQLLEKGIAGSLEDAYDKALWLNPDTRGLGATTAQPQQTAAEKAASARKRAVSPRSSAPTGNAGKSSDPGSRRAELEKNFDSVTSGRI